MPDTFQAIYDLVDNFTGKYLAIQDLITGSANQRVMIDIGIKDNVASRFAGLNSQLDRMSDKTNVLGTSKLVDDLKKSEFASKMLSNEMGRVGNNMDKPLSKMQQLKNATTETTDAFGRMAAFATSLAIGGSISGFAAKGALESKYKDEQTAALFDKNAKKWGVTGKEIETFSDKFNGAGWTRGTEMQDLATSIYGMGGKKLRGTVQFGTAGQEKVKMDKGLALAEAIGARSLARTESMAAVGLSPEMVGMAVSRKGGAQRMSKSQQVELAAVLNMDVDTMLKKSPKFLQKQLLKIGAEVNIDEEKSKRPWLVLQNSLKDLRKEIGKSLEGPFMVVSKAVNIFVGLLKNIPGLPMLVGLAASVVTLVSAIGLLHAVLAPGITLMMGWLGLEKAATASTITNTAAKRMSAVASVQGTAANRAHAFSLSLSGIAAKFSAAGFWAAASGVWAMLAPLLLIAIPLIALGAALYFAEKKAHIFSNAFKALGKTQMSKDLINWFKEIGEWIQRGIKWIDNLYKTGGAGALIKLAIAAIVFGPFLLIVKTLQTIAEFFIKLIFGNDAIARILTFASALWKKIVDIASDLWDGVKNLVKWIKDGLGITKSEERKKLDKAIAKEKENTGDRYQYVENKKMKSGAVYTGWMKGDSQTIDPEDVPKKIMNAFGPWKEASSGIFGEIPGIELLRTTIEDLIAKIGDWIGIFGDDEEEEKKKEKEKNVYTTNPITGITTDQNGKVVTKTPDNFGNFNYIPATPKTTVAPIQPPTFDAGYEAFKQGGTHVRAAGAEFQFTGEEQAGDTYEEKLKFANKFRPGMLTAANGASFASGGWFSGLVHPPEEIIPQATAIKGPGPISKAIARLGDGSKYSSKSASSKTTFTNMTVPVRIDKVSSDVDIRKMTSHIENVVKRALAQQRT